MTTRLAIAALLACLVVSAAQAAEPATPKNAAQWCKAWQSGTQLDRFAVLYPGGLGFARTFEQQRANGLAKRNLLGRCVSLTARKLAKADQAASADGASLPSRCKADLARAGSAYTNVGRCVSDGGRQLRP